MPLKSILKRLGFSNTLITVNTMDKNSWLIVGLGNPGSKYEKNRHNVGFLLIDDLATSFSKKFDGLFAQGTVSGHKIFYLKPQTYMNESGQSVGKAARYYKIPPERILIIHDELDLAFGKVKGKFGGGHAGHNGLKSINAHLGTAEYYRLRIGIGHPGHKELVNKHVLSDFSKEEDLRLPLVLQEAQNSLKSILNTNKD